jgi:predicted 3-demethylubiquinone-9 3-methyltransferase (glyoxalase superfamily)
MKESLMQKITPFLWFDDQAEDAARFYISVFKNSKITKITHYPKATEEVSGKPEGSAMTVAFELEGQKFVALNGGPHFTITPAISFVVDCETQDAVDAIWGRLSEGGDEAAQQCGWLKDKFGVSWQIVPTALHRLLSDPARSERVMGALLKMKKIDVAKLEAA